MAMTKSLPCGRPIPKKPETSRASANQSWKTKLEAYLAENGLNQSEARNNLVELVLQQTEHFTVQELIKRLGEKFPQIGAATVYRNVPILVDVGVLKETLTDDSGQKFYEVAGDDHHDHIVCIDCHRIFEFHDERIERAQDQAAEAMSFHPVKHRHVVYASCAFRKK
jgi:Fur family ferric uptake transcriptional regulator